MRYIRHIDRLKVNSFNNAAYATRVVPISRTVTFAAPSETLTNFPVLVKSNATFGIATGTGYDVHFEDMSGNELYYELDYYDPVTGNGAWWVQIPSLSSSGTTSIKMLYGDPAASTDGSSPTTVWSGYLAVYHFSSSDPSQQYNSANGSYVTWTECPYGNKSVSFTSGGVTGRMLQVNQLFHWNNPSSLSFNTSSVDNGRYNCTTIMEAHPRWTRSGEAAIGELGSDASAIDCMRVYSNQFYNRQTPYTQGNLEYLNLAWDGYNSSLSWQVNNTQETGALATSWAPGTSTVTLLKAYYSGSSGASATYKVDEIRLKNTMPPAGYAAYEYNQLMDHTNYTTYGPEIKG